MCFDCRQSALMSLKERWMVEMESRMVYIPGPPQDAVIGYKVRGCRCSIPFPQLSAISVCPGCEGIQVERRLKALNSIGYSNMNRLGGKGGTMREEHKDVWHDPGIEKAPEPQYQSIQTGIELLGGENSGMGTDVPEEHFQGRNAEVGRQGPKEIAVRVASTGLDSKQGAFNAPEPQPKADDVGARPQGSQGVAVRAGDSDPEYEPGAIEDDDSSSPASTPSLDEDS